MENAPAACVVMDDDGKNRHGYPRGYHFVPEPIELIGILEDKRADRRLAYPPNIFHDVKILDYHPADLYEAYKGHEEAGFIYFFSHRVFPEPRGARVHPVRVARGGGWRASGGGKPVQRHGVDVGYENTLAFYQKKRYADDRSSGLTAWGLHEYTAIIGPNKKVADLALYRLYKKNKEVVQHVAAVSNGSSKLQELPSPGPAAGGTCMASTSQPRAPSLPITIVNCSPTSPPQQAIDHYKLADWDKMLLLPPPPAAFAEYPGPVGTNELMKMLQPPTLPAPDYADLDDELKVLCEMHPAMSPCWFSMPGDDDLPMLTDEENQLTLSELLMRQEEPDTND